MTDDVSTCRYCNAQLPANRNKNTRYCDRKCASKNNILRAAKRLPFYECCCCGVMFQPKRHDRTMTCSRECGFKVSGAIQKLKRTGGRVWVRTKRNVPVVIKRERANYPPRPLSCNRCGSHYYASVKQQQICSDKCREEGRLESKRKAKSKRRAIIRRAPKSENVDPFKVFDRDGWRCQICMKKTLRSKRGTPHDMAPELDHILPLSKGGDHSYANTQCTCRKCNGLKSDNVYGQIPMFAT